MEKYIKLSDAIEELDRLVRTKQIEPIHTNLDQMEENFERMSIKSINDFDGIVAITQNLKREYEDLLDDAEKGKSHTNPVYLEGHLCALDELEEELKDIKERTKTQNTITLKQNYVIIGRQKYRELISNNNNPLDLQVMPKIADYLEKLIKEYLQTLKTDRYKEDATFNVDEYYADLQKVMEDLRRLKKYIDSNFSE